MIEALQDTEQGQRMKYKTIFERCHNIIQDREDSYGDARPLHQSIAKRWSAVLSNKLAPGAELNEVDIARMMGELKAARMDLNGFHEDSLLDQINYLAIAYRLQKDDV